jgi:hypothetical protein
MKEGEKKLRKTEKYKRRKKGNNEGRMNILMKGKEKKEGRNYRWLSVTSETLVNFYQTTRCNNPEDSHLHTHRCESLKSHKEGIGL